MERREKKEREESKGRKEGRETRERSACGHPCQSVRKKLSLLGATSWNLTGSHRSIQWLVFNIKDFLNGKWLPIRKKF